MSSLEGGGQREEGAAPSRAETCWPDSPKLERGVCPLLEAAQRWVSPGHLFLGVHPGLGTEAPEQNLSHANQHPRAIFNCFLVPQVPCPVISKEWEFARRGIWRLWEGLSYSAAAVHRKALTFAKWPHVLLETRTLSCPSNGHLINTKLCQVPGSSP